MSQNDNDLERLSSVVRDLTRKETAFNYDDPNTGKSGGKLIEAIARKIDLSNNLSCFGRAVVWFLCGASVGVAGLAWLLPQSNYGWFLFGCISGSLAVLAVCFGFRRFRKFFFHPPS